MAKEIEITRIFNPAYPDISTYKVDVASNLIVSKLQTDMLYQMMASLVTRVSDDILKEHGEAMVQTIIKQDTEIKDKIINTICKNAEWFAHELMVMQRDFENKELCVCGQIHGLSLRPPIKFDHEFVPMTNLQYLEHRYDRVQKWIRSLSYE